MSRMSAQRESAERRKSGGRGMISLVMLLYIEYMTVLQSQKGVSLAYS